MKDVIMLIAFRVGLSLVAIGMPLAIFGASGMVASESNAKTTAFKVGFWVWLTGAVVLFLGLVISSFYD